jgi:branched-chain amino acid transport system ATP-binding protein
MPLLKVHDLNAFYGDVHILFDLNLEVRTGQLVSIVGANAAGKTTLLRCLSGLLKRVSGSILFKEEELVEMPAYEIVSKGIVHIPQGRRVFPALTVQENLEVGAYSRRIGVSVTRLAEKMYDFFPELATHRRQLAGSLSGGEQQMLAIARGLVAQPALLAVDEPSLGLAPLLVEKTFQILGKIKEENVTLLLVEQNVFKALTMADEAYVIENGRMTLQGSGADLLKDEYLKKAYLGM